MPAVARAETLPVVSVIHQSSTNCVSAEPTSESAWPLKTVQNRSCHFGPEGRPTSALAVRADIGLRQAAAQRLVESHRAAEFTAPQVQLRLTGGVQLPLGVEQLQPPLRSRAIAQVRQFGASLGAGHRTPLRLDLPRIGFSPG